mmetsp:Transcript_66150/g.162859  ORF Transcript_66150/g.162859 Transcript_66150/m.162859 type:complete len:243 (-) Transcript_66150:1437-2165(-)
MRRLSSSGTLYLLSTRVTSASVISFSARCFLSCFSIPYSLPLLSPFEAIVFASFSTLSSLDSLRLLKASTMCLSIRFMCSFSWNMLGLSLSIVVSLIFLVFFFKVSSNFSASSSTRPTLTHAPSLPSSAFLFASRARATASLTFSRSCSASSLPGSNLLTPVLLPCEYMQTPKGSNHPFTIFDSMPIPCLTPSDQLPSHTTVSWVNLPSPCRKSVSKCPSYTPRSQVSTPYPCASTPIHSPA